MNPHEITPALVLAARQELARSHVVDFVQYTTPRWSPGPIHNAIGDAFDRIARGEVDRLMLLCPPQHGKSSIASKRFPAYMLGRNPTLDIISASATSLLAGEFGGEVRDCVGSPEFRQTFHGVELKADTQAKDRWRTAQGGGYYAVGIGGTLFGRGAGLGIIDDPFGSWEDAQSEMQRRKVWNWYQGTFYNRIRPGGAIVVIQHRMHEDDLVGMLLNEEARGGDKWTVINLPADLDNPPWPQRYDRKALERIKANTSQRQWSALYMQNPTPDDGTYFLRTWFKRYRPGSQPKRMNTYMTSDHAPSGSLDGDWTVFRIWGVDQLGDIYLLDGFRQQETIDKSIDRVVGVDKTWKPGHLKRPKMQGLIKKWAPLAWFPEDDNTWKASKGFVVKQMLAEGSFVRIEPISPMGGDKSVKAQAFQGLASMGKVWFPDTPEGDEILAEYLKFPGGKHDDDVDNGSLIGRAIASSHPAVIPVAEEKPYVDSWDRVFAKNRTEADDWKSL